MAYAYWRKITIDATKVPGDLTNYPFLFNSTLAELKTVANGGHIENTATGGASGNLTVPADLVFAADKAAVTVYDFEVEKYDPATGELIAWVRIPSVSGSIDTDLYLCYGDPTVTTSQENVAGVWDINYIAVHHLYDETTSLLPDSTANNNDGTKVAADNPLEIAAKIGYGQRFDATDDYVDLGDIDALDGLAELTIEAWAKADTIVGTLSYITCKEDTPPGWILRRDDDVFNFYIYDTAWRGPASSGSISANQWYHVVAVYDNSLPAADQLRLYLDGALAGSASGTGDITGSNVNSVWFGSFGSVRLWDGDLDEIRLSNVARSSDVIGASYNNQNDPATFYTVSAENVAARMGVGVPGNILAAIV